jgi:hypothetical protein
MKTFILLKISILLLISLSANAQERDRFYRIVSIDKPFHFSTHTTVADASKRESYEKFLEKLTNIWANVLVSYQQEYDYEFVANYKNKKKVQADEALGAMLIVGEEVMKELPNEIESLPNGKQKDVSGTSVRYVFKRILDNPEELFVAFYEKSERFPELYVNFMYSLDSLIQLKDQELLLKLQKAQKESWYNRLPISYKLKANNDLKVKRSIAIDELIEGENGVSEKYLLQLTDVMANCLINRQKDSIIHAKFNAFRNYEYKDKKQTTEAVLKGKLTHKKEYDSYTINIWIEDRKTGVQVFDGFGTRISFSEKEKYSYNKVVQKINLMVGGVLHAYFQEINQQEGDIQLNDKK